MASYADIELDTTPPEISWGVVSVVREGQQLVVPYSVTEPGVASAEIVSTDGNRYPGVVADDEIEFALPRYLSPGGATLEVLLRDEVLNERRRDQPLMSLNPRFPLRALVEDRRAVAAVDEAKVGVEVERRDAVAEPDELWP